MGGENEFMNETTIDQYAIYAELWEVDGEMLEDSLIDGPLDFEHPRGNHDDWQRRLDEMRKKNRPSSWGNGPHAGKRTVYRNLRLVNRTVTITIDDWSPFPALEGDQ